MKRLLILLLVIGIWLLVIPSYCRADSYSVIPPVQVGLGVHSAPVCDPKNSEDKCAQNFSNDATKGLKCTFNASVAQSFQPHEVTPTPFPPGHPTPTGPIDQGPFFEPYDVNEIEEQKNPNDLTNSGFRSSAIHFAKQPPFDPSQSDEDRRRQFLSYGYNGQDGQNSTVRTLPYNVMLKLRGDLLEQAVVSLDGNDVITTDELVAYEQGGSLQALFPKPAGNPRPIPISEIAYFYYQKGDSTSYRLKDYNQLEKTSYSADAIDVLENYPSRYQNRFGRSLSLLSDSDYKLLYRHLQIVPRGSTNTILYVYRQKSDGSYDIQVVDKTIPLSAPLSSSQVSYTLNLLKPRQQEVPDLSSTVCSDTLESAPIKDKPSLNSFTAFIQRFFGTVNDKSQTYGGSIRVEKYTSQSSVDNLSSNETFLKNMISANQQKKYGLASYPVSSTGGDTNANIPEPGLRLSQYTEFVYRSFTPKSWKNDPDF